MQYKNRGFCLVSLFLCAIFLLLQYPVTCFSTSETTKTIRVGYPIQEGLTEMDEHGNYSGYTYEYLLEIAQYTGWSYEFVKIPGDLNSSLTKMLDMLKEGKLDLMGGVRYNEATAEIYDYTDHSYGTSYLNLSALDENTSINESNLSSFGTLRIAVTDTSKVYRETLEQYCAANQIPYELVLCDGMERVNMLKDGKADVMLKLDSEPMEGLRTITKFSPQPFYFITTKGNQEVVNGINSAILQIDQADPYYASTLYEKYFHSSHSFYLNDDEQAFIAKTAPIRVVMYPSLAPIQFHDQDSGALSGLSSGVLSYITEKTGLKFEVKAVGSMDELKAAVKNQEADIVSGLVYSSNFMKENSIVLTRPYGTTQTVTAVNNRVNTGDLSGKKLARAKSFFEFNGQYIGKVSWYENVEECLNAVDSGEADYTYSTSYSTQYYMNENRYKNIVLIPQSGDLQKICFGVIKPIDKTLLSILNKTINSLSDQEREAIVYRSIIQADQPITLGDFIDANPRQAMLLFTGVVLFLLVLLILYMLYRSRNTRQLRLEHQRFLQLSKLSNECIFEYSCKKDTLTFSDKSAQIFGFAKEIESFFQGLTQNRTNYRTELIQYIQSLFAEGEGTTDLRFKMPNGQLRWIRITATAVYDKNHVPTYIIGKITDIQDEIEEKQRLLMQAHTDSLTEVYNAASSRSLISDILKKKIGTGALFIIDIDHFKDINDQYGHYVGDLVLVNIARLLKDAFRQNDIVGRLGGDEFLVFMQNIADTAILEKKAALLKEKTHIMELNGQTVQVTLSIGIAVSEHEPYDMLYQRADKMLYEVKKNGRNGFMIENA